LPDSVSSFPQPASINAAAAPSTTFEAIAEQRGALQDFCSLHVSSIEYFAAQSLPIFRLSDREPDKFKHITSTATCYESLAECPARLRPKAANFEKRGEVFSAEAVELDQDDWKSDESAYIYCRCRGLPYVVSRLSGAQITKARKHITEHLDRVFAQFNPERPAIGEADPETQPNKEDWYPPNAYHTFWTLELLSICERFPTPVTRALDRRLNLSQRSHLMKEWARQSLGYQVSLHCAKSSALDSDQLAWSLAILARSPHTYLSKLSEQDFVRQAFKCLFSTQTEVGNWPRYVPLFHYKKSGNAYCYIFETFTAMLKQALRPEAKFVRDVLKQYFGNLIRLWEYAKTTQTAVDGSGRTLAWSSGHRVAQPIESWATASVFAYAQCLRRLVGIWTREEAARSLNRPRPFATRKQAIRKLEERSDVWKSGGPPLEEQLWAMFINQTCTTGFDDRMEPDRQPIGEDCLRSAILFGPPGTSKTTLVKALARSIRWDYVELHASHFVADGLPNVQKTADQIFKRLLELDHSVVLFDEIDELVRAREIEKDAFGRFLTTSMLPKLAELWEARKIMYFVATNHIEFFDPAITRSQRFDAVLFISPPSFELKKRRLEELLSEKYGITSKIRLTFQYQDVESALATFGSTDRMEQPLEAVLAKFALLRFDELGELALNLKRDVEHSLPITSARLAEALRRIHDGRWRGPQEYESYLRGPSFERLDLTKTHIWRVKGSPTRLSSPFIKAIGEELFLIAPVRSVSDVSIPQHEIVSMSHGRVRIVSKSAPRARAKKASK
jgi:hypothetical protein